jgi:hypothetical protein
MHVEDSRRACKAIIPFPPLNIYRVVYRLLEYCYASMELFILACCDRSCTHKPLVSASELRMVTIFVTCEYLLPYGIPARERYRRTNKGYLPPIVHRLPLYLSVFIHFR